MKLLSMLLKKSNKENKKPNLISRILSDPENFILEAYIENDELNIKIKKKPEA